MSWCWLSWPLGTFMHGDHQNIIEVTGRVMENSFSFSGDPTVHVSFPVSPAGLAILGVTLHPSDYSALSQPVNT